MKKSKIIFLIELVLNIIAAVFLVINNSFKNLLDVGVVFLLLLLLIWNFLRRKIEISLKLSWLNLMILPAIFTYCLNTVANVLLVKYPVKSVLIAIIYSLLFLVYLLPVVITNAGLVKNKYARVFIAMYYIVLLLFSENLHMNDYLSSFVNWSHSEILNGLALIPIIFCLFKSWDIRAKLNLKFRRYSNIQLIVLLVAVFFAAWYSFFHSYVYIAPTFSQLFWNWDFSEIIPTERAVLWSLGAILFEEGFRYLLIIVLLEVFKVQRGQIELTIFLSALFFGLIHYAGLLDQGPIFIISTQAIFAFGYGCFLATLYLYSGKFWLVLLSHFSLDLIAFSLSAGGGEILSWYGNNDLLSNGLSMIFALVMTLIMFLGKQRKIMQENAARLINA